MSAELLTAVFTGLTVVAMGVGLWQNHRSFSVNMVPYLPHVHHVWLRDQVLLRVTPPESTYKIKRIVLSPQQPLLRRTRPDGTNEHGTPVYAAEGPLASKIVYADPAGYAYISVSLPVKGTLKIHLVSETLPSKTIVIKLDRAKSS